MKTTTPTYHKTVIALLASLMVLGGASSLWAQDWDARHHYRRDNYGYYDGRHYRHYEYWHHHHGYWDTRGGPRVFINVD